MEEARQPRDLPNDEERLREVYQRKRNQGTTALGHAVLAQAHRHILILHAMIRNDILYDPHSSTQPPAAA